MNKMIFLAFESGISLRNLQQLFDASLAIRVLGKPAIKCSKLKIYKSTAEFCMHKYACLLDGQLPTYCSSERTHAIFIVVN